MAPATVPTAAVLVFVPSEHILVDFSSSSSVFFLVDRRRHRRHRRRRCFRLRHRFSLAAVRVLGRTKA